MMFSKKNVLLLLIFGLCCFLSIHSTSFSNDEKIIVYSASKEVQVEDDKHKKGLKDFFSNRLYINPMDVPACGFFENKCVEFYVGNHKKSFYIAPCDCGYVQVWEDGKEQYIYLLPHELDWLKDYVKNSINNGVGFYD